MVKFRPLEVTIVLFDAGQEMPVDEELEVDVAEVPVLVDVELEATQVVFWYTVRRLPAPQNSELSAAHSMLQSLELATVAPAPKLLPQ